MERNEKPQLAAGATVGTFPTTDRAGGRTALMLARSGATVKEQQDHRLTLLRQATAAMERARATAAWHYERAARYLSWIDLPWARQRYDFHLGQAAYQDTLAARHAAIREALEGVQP